MRAYWPALESAPGCAFLAQLKSIRFSRRKKPTGGIVSASLYSRQPPSRSARRTFSSCSCLRWAKTRACIDLMLREVAATLCLERAARVGVAAMPHDVDVVLARAVRLKVLHLSLKVESHSGHANLGGAALCCTLMCIVRWDFCVNVESHTSGALELGRRGAVLCIYVLLDSKVLGTRTRAARRCCILMCLV